MKYCFADFPNEATVAIKRLIGVDELKRSISSLNASEQLSDLTHTKILGHIRKMSALWRVPNYCELFRLSNVKLKQEIIVKTSSLFYDVILTSVSSWLEAIESANRPMAPANGGWGGGGRPTCLGISNDWNWSSICKMVAGRGSSTLSRNGSVHLFRWFSVY